MGDLYIFSKLIRPGKIALSENKYSLVYPQLPLPSQDYVPEFVSPTVTTTISWERPVLVKLLWIVSLFFILILSYYVLRNEGDIKKYLVNSVTIWGFQEAIILLIPSIRPLEITLFEAPILISVITTITYLVRYR